MLRLKPKPLTERPLVSVVIPCYNYGRYLPEAVKSVLDQPDVDLEVIIVDDASTDASVAAAEALAASDPRVRLVRHEVNQGHIATYNDGLGRVNGDLMVLLSADDLLAPGSLKRAAALFEARPEVGLVYGHAKEFADGTPPSMTPGSSMPTSWTVWKGHEWLGIACLRGRNFILSPEVVVRSSVLGNVGGYNPKLPHSGDLEYWLRVSERWQIAHLGGPPQAYYRVHGKNMHQTDYHLAAVDLKHRLEAFRSVTYMGSLDARSRRILVLRAERAIRRQALQAAREILDTSADKANVTSLVALANEACDGRKKTPRSLIEPDMNRADPGKRKGTLRRMRQAIKLQLDRVRWTTWRKVGIS